MYICIFTVTVLLNYYFYLKETYYAHFHVHDFILCSHF